MSSGNPQGIYGGIQGAFWLLTLAVFFITGSWIVFLFAAGISAILGTLARPIMAGLGSMAFFGTKQQQPPQQYYQPPQQALSVIPGRLSTTEVSTRNIPGRRTTLSISFTASVTV